MEKKNYLFQNCSNEFNSWKESILSYSIEENSEADTRSKYIDSLFKEVFGWEETQIKREKYASKIGYYDYLFDSGKNKFIVEAKKDTIEFKMPRKNKSVKLFALEKSSPELVSAIKQGIDYAATKRVQVVLVSNGTQMAITYLPNINKIKSNDTLLFSSIEDMEEQLIVLYNLLSPNLEGEKHLADTITNGEDAPIIRGKPTYNSKVNSLQDSKDSIITGNQITTYFEQIHNIYFSNITDDEELLRKCYCDNESNTKYEKEIEAVLRDRAPLMSYPVEKPAQDIETTKKSAGTFEKLFFTPKNTKMFLLLGGSGVGKTTFIFRFFNYIIKEEQRQHLVWLYLDFKKLNEEAIEIDEFILSEIEDQLFEKYNNLELFTNPKVLEAIYSEDLKKSSGFISFYPTEGEKQSAKADLIRKWSQDKKHTVKRIYEYLKSLGMSTSLVYDNVDQLENEVQTRVFKSANAYRENLHTTILFSMREEVFYENKDNKKFNFSDIEIFHVPAPRFTNVLAKRLKYLKSKTPEGETFKIENQKGSFVNVKKQDILEVLKQTFLGDEENILLIEMLSNKDLRDCLQLFKAVISSSSINFDNLLISAGMYAQKHKSFLKLDKNEILLGMALRNRTHYESQKSEIKNIFEVEDDGFYSHFTKLRILKYAQSKLHNKISTNPAGYFNVKVMYDEIFSNLVKDLPTFMEICKSLQTFGALNNSKGLINSISKDDFLMLGPAGQYYLKNLKSHPYYLFLAATDTQIASLETHNAIMEEYSKYLNSSVPMVPKRIEYIALKMAEYLKEEEEKEKKFLESLNVHIPSELMCLSEDIHSELKETIG
ncbi:hypothetical protein ATL39_1952 [Sinobaca qinghaiensis]|uniref:Uncharacterized protein n=1 Tax=Sinobaca qinghaiensis TaxID=342944 RepID=A0A419V553_9BACL|nr:hypothetical protein [Sinobaca qinghaiensis]RKD73650.1 hypothetical protein ATL39_1952 [Sinobaca qinghaiensis]